VTGDMIRKMNDDPIVFAMANPVPEVMPDVARAAGAAIVGTGRSDFGNQINNALAFPGVFRGALDARATRINDDMKVAAAHALAGYVAKPARDHIMPAVLDRHVVRAVADAVQRAALGSGVARDTG
jgi:malate dehydrogenase (oxaloacetate-decarboxylating)